MTTELRPRPAERANGARAIDVAAEPEPRVAAERRYWQTCARIFGYVFAATLGLVLALVVLYGAVAILIGLLVGAAGGGAGD